MSEQFKYSYSAPTEQERKEIEQIKQRYEKGESKGSLLQQIKVLDSKVRNIPVCVALAMGVIGVLIFGLGMTLALEWQQLVWGIVVGAVGCIPMALAYYVYNFLYNKLRNKYADQIVELSNQLLKEDDEK